MDLIALSTPSLNAHTPDMPSATTQLLLSQGFSCPFLLPSFFIRSNLRRVQAQRGVAPATVQNQKSCQLSFVQYSSASAALRYITVETKLLQHAGTKISCKAMCLTPQLPASTQFPRDGSQHSMSTCYTRTSTEPFPWQRGVRRYSTKVQKARSSTSAKSTEIAPSLTIRKPPEKGPLPTEKLRPKPKWVKAGISRTKVKSAGRKARRAAKKVKKGGLVGTEQKKDQACKGFLASINSFDMAAYETAVLEGGSWRNLLEKAVCKMQPRVKNSRNKGNAKAKCEGDKATVSTVPVAAKESSGGTKQKKEKQVVIPQDIIAPGTGSRISVRGDRKIERTLGKGRSVLGTSPVTPMVPFETIRTFGTLAKFGMNDRRDEPPWRGNVLGTKTGRSKECTEVNPISIWSHRSLNFYMQKIHQ